MLERFRTTLLQLAPHRGSRANAHETVRFLERIEDALRTLGQTVHDHRVLARTDGEAGRLFGSRVGYRLDAQRPMRRRALNPRERREMTVRGVDGRASHHRRRDLWFDASAFVAHDRELPVHTP